MRPLELLSNIHGRLSAYSTAKALYAERLAPDFNVLEFLDTRENGLSRIFAWLVNPKGNHAQGDRFLVAFIRWLDLDPSWEDAAATAYVTLEAVTTTGPSTGFIDILIRLGDRAIAIENKPTAGDQPLQVSRYLDDLKVGSPGGHCLLYLSGSGNGPSELSISKVRATQELAEGRLRVAGYAALITWLDSCAGLCRAASVAMSRETACGFSGLAVEPRGEA